MDNSQPKKRGRKPKKKIINEDDNSQNIITQIILQNDEVVTENNKDEQVKELKDIQVVNNNEKVKKKRGRKPKNALNNLKNQEETEKKIPKKRGRKPKETIYSIKQIENIILKDESDTVILHLAIHSDDIKDDNNVTNYDPQINIPEPYEKEENFYENIGKDKAKVELQNNTENNITETISNSELIVKKNNIIKEEEDNDEINNEIIEDINTCISNNDINKICYKKLKSIQYEYIDANHKKIWLQNTQIYCMWCCHPFDGIPVSIPQKYNNNKFYVYGNFCSFNCAASHIFSKNDDYMWKQYNLLNTLQKKISNNNWKKIKLAPPKEVLKIFGGYMTIDEYREELLTGNTEFKVIEPPLISLVPKIEETYFKSQNNNLNKKKYVPIDNDLIDKAKISMKLKREKPINNSKSTLHNFMDLKII